MEKKVSSGTIARTAALVLALLNQSLGMAGYQMLPIDDEMVNAFVTNAFTFVSAMVAWWQNNSFSKEAIEADEILAEKKLASKVSE